MFDQFEIWRKKRVQDCEFIDWLQSIRYLALIDFFATDSHFICQHERKWVITRKKKWQQIVISIIIWRNHMYICILLQLTILKPNSISVIDCVTSHFTFAGVSFYFMFLFSWAKEWNGAQLDKLIHHKKNNNEYKIHRMAWIFDCLFGCFFNTTNDNVLHFAFEMSSQCQLRNTHSSWWGSYIQAYIK